MISSELFFSFPDESTVIGISGLKKSERQCMYQSLLLSAYAAVVAR